MGKFRFDILASNLPLNLLNKEIKIFVGVDFEGKREFIKYKVVSVKPQSSNLLDFILNELKGKIPEIKEKEKFIEKFKEFEQEYKRTHPLTLITIKDIPFNFVLDEKTKDIPQFFYGKAEEFILALSLIFSAPIKPIFYLFSEEGNDRKLLRLPVGGLTIDKYKKLYKKRNFDDLLKNYLWRVIAQQRVIKGQNEKINELALRLKIALNFYRTALATTSIGRVPIGTGIRFVNYWTALETLAFFFKEEADNSDFLEKLKNRYPEKEKLSTADYVRYTVQKYFPGEIYPIGKWYGMRSSVVHQGRPKEGCNYPKANGDIRELIEKIILKMLISD